MEIQSKFQFDSIWQGWWYIEWTHFPHFTRLLKHFQRYIPTSNLPACTHIYIYGSHTHHHAGCITNIIVAYLCDDIVAVISGIGIILLPLPRILWFWPWNAYDEWVAVKNTTRCSTRSTNYFKVFNTLQIITQPSVLMGLGTAPRRAFPGNTIIKVSWI